MSEIKLVVGLGNPGSQYVGTRHNIGFEILDELAREIGVGFKMERKWEGEVAQAPGGGWLLKPMTFMNLSGRSVAGLVRFYRWEPEQVLVVYDDIALEVGAFKFRMKGGAGGHNGIKSMIQSLGSSEFPRLKIGVGAARGEGLVGHVLGRFSPEEKNLMQNTLATSVSAVQLALSAGVSHAANHFNIRKKPKEEHPSDDEQEIRRTDCVEHERERQGLG